jgi:hypothetical protein
MKQSDVVLHDERSNVANPFGMQIEEPLQKQAATGKREPKLNKPGDIGGFGSIHGGG